MDGSAVVVEPDTLEDVEPPIVVVVVVTSGPQLIAPFAQARSWTVCQSDCGDAATTGDESAVCVSAAVPPAAVNAATIAASVASPLRDNCEIRIAQVYTVTRTQSCLTDG